MLDQRRGAIVATSWCLFLASILTFDVLAGPKADPGAAEFRFRDGKGVDRMVPVDHLWFHIYSGSSKTARYSTRAVYDPESRTYVNFKDMGSFTVEKGPDGYLATFTTPGKPGSRTLGFFETGKFLGAEYVPAMLIKLSGQSARKHEYIPIDEVAWPIEVKR
jgi:hypothetical protein